MDNQSSQAFLEKLEIFYLERSSILQEIELPALIRHNNQLAFLFTENNTVTIVRKLLNHYLNTNQSWWAELLNSPESHYDIFQQSSQTPACMQYQTLFGYAETRLVKAFIKEFCAPDYSIDWQKLLRFRAT